MGTKDKTEKLFVACKDVFAELINVLLYRGDEVLTEGSLLPGPTESIYQGKDAALTNQFQDYSMYDVTEGKACALYTLENQSGVDYRMMLRHAGYEGAAYRRQYKQQPDIYPVISMVLNWGTRRWNAAVTIRELIRFPVREEAEDYLDRNRLHVFDMRYLDGAIRTQFKGDVRIVLDYLCDRKSLIQRRQTLRNPEETLRMLHALSGDIRYLENINFMTEKGGMTVCDLLDEMVNKGLEQGRKEGIQEGIQKGIQKGIQEGIQEGIRALISTCRRLKLSFDETSATVKEEFSLGDEETGKNMKLYW